MLYHCHPVGWLLPILFLLPTLALAAENVLIGKVIKVADGDTISILTADN